MKRITKEIFSILKESDEVKEYSDELMRYIYDETTYDVDRNGSVSNINFPEYDYFNDYIMSIDKKSFDEAVEKIRNALSNVKLYNESEGSGVYLELSDNHTMYDLNDNGKSEEEWYSIIDSKSVEFENETDVPLKFLGRSGRHVCVDLNLKNIINYNKLKEVQERLEKEAVAEFNNEVINESDDINDALADDIRKVADIEPGSDEDQALNDINKPTYGVTYDCIIKSGDLMARQYQIQSDESFSLLLKLSDDEPGTWIDVIRVEPDDWTWEFNQYIFSNDSVEDEEAKKRQEIIDEKYAEDVLQIIYDFAREFGLDRDDLDEADYSYWSSVPNEELTRIVSNLLSEYKGSKISKMINKVEGKINLLDLANSLEVEWETLLRTLEYMCSKGLAKEIDDSTYLILDNVKEYEELDEAEEQIDDELLAAKLADFSLDTTDEENWNEYTDEEYYDKNKKDYLSQINDVNFIKGVVSLLQDRVNNEGPSADGYDRDIELLDLFKHKLESLKLGEALDVNRKRNKGLKASISRIKSEIENIDKENESCADEEKSKKLIDKRDDLVKRLEQLEKMNESSTNKDYELIEAKEEDLDKLYDNSAFTFEGFRVDDENLTKLVNFLKKNTDVILPIKIYRISGEMMNSKYGLTEDNAYPNDLNIVSLPLTNWKKLGNLPSYKIQMDARWFDDIVDNNAYRQEEINMPEKNIYKQDNE